MSLTISRILHAGYVINCDQTTIAFDPIFENPFSHNCYAFPEIHFDLEKIRKLQFDAVFISHYHDDHCSLESLNLLNRKTPIYLFCLFDELFEMIRELGFANVIPLILNKTISVGPLSITPRRALDEEVDCIFHIQTKELNILNVVDSWIAPETLEELVKLNPWDMILWPFQSMREIEVLSPLRFKNQNTEIPPEFLPQLKKLNPRYLVPSSCQFKQESWSWYNKAFFPISYKKFESEMMAILSNTQIVRLNPSQSFTFDQGSSSSPSLNWISPIGDQDLDYEFEPDYQAPPTSEISKKFPKLGKTEIEIILKYCQQDILEKYFSLPDTDDNYFYKERFWQLTVHNHEETYIFYYKIIREQMTLLTESPAKLSWTTSVPAYKVLQALNSGETLTSMYIRINNQWFDAETEADLADVDILNDPMVRCLFTQAFANYQIEQLKRIKTYPLS